MLHYIHIIKYFSFIVKTFAGKILLCDRSASDDRQRRQRYKKSRLRGRLLLSLDNKYSLFLRLLYWVSIVNTGRSDGKLTQIIPPLPNVRYTFFNVNGRTVMRIHTHVIKERIVGKLPVSLLMGMTMKSDDVSTEMLVIKVSSKNRIMAQEQRQFAELYKFAGCETVVVRPRLVCASACFVDAANFVVCIMISTDKDYKTIQSSNDISIIMTHHHITKVVHSIALFYDLVPPFYYRLVHFLKILETTGRIKEVLFMVEMGIRGKENFTHELV